ncbi:MAG: MBL fold metallo-hydrolase [Janthinobacterium lividum]
MLSNHATRASTPDFAPVVPGLWVLRDVFVNLYYAAAAPAQPPGPWVLIDAGLPGSADKIQRHAQEVFGATPPVAIVLTHGHFDHVSALPGLLAAWPDVPVYAHPLELPYLTGRSSYPPPDPTVGGGAMAYLSFLYPKKPLDLGGRVHALPADGTVPGLPGWRWLHTPGHAFGHVSLFRADDRVLVAGDAFTTVVGESGLATLTQRQVVHGPPAYFTPDWDAARDSVERLAALAPEVAATGHGIAMHGPALREQLLQLARKFDERARPKTGRYARTPATADASGVRSVPPPVAAPWAKGVLVAGALAGVAFLLARGQHKKRRPAPGNKLQNPSRYADRARRQRPAG